MRLERKKREGMEVGVGEGRAEEGVLRHIPALPVMEQLESRAAECVCHFLQPPICCRPRRSGDSGREGGYCFPCL